MADLRETLEAVVDQAETNPDQDLQPIEHQEQEAPQTGQDRPSTTSSEDEKSPVASRAPTQARKGSEGATGSEKGEEAARQLAAAQGKKTEAQTAVKTEPKEHITQKAPASWTAEAKGAWETVPLNVRQEILRREKQIDEALGSSTQARQIADNLMGVVSPYMERLQKNGVPVMQSINNLLAADQLLSTAEQPRRAAFLAKIIKDYGIDVQELDSALAGQIQGKPDPQEHIQRAVQAAIQPLLGPVNAWQQEQSQAKMREQQEAQLAVQQMEMDPKYEFFSEVRDYMADIVDMYNKRGLAISAEDAYTKAIQTHPEISGIIAARNQEEASKTAYQRQTEAAARARRAGSSVGSSSPVGGSPSSGNGTDLRSTIEAAFANAGGGGRI